MEPERGVQFNQTLHGYTNLMQVTDECTRVLNPIVVFSVTCAMLLSI